MPRFLIKPQNITNDHITIQGPDVRHIKTVLRAKIGDKLHLTNGKGTLYEGSIKKIDRDITVKIISQKQINTSPIDLCCAQALIKNDKMDWVIQKTIELGVKRLIPFTSERTVPKGTQEGRQQRWQKIAQGAIKQSGHAFQTKIDPLLSFEQALKTGQDYDLKILCWEEDDSHSLKKILRNPDRDLSMMKSIFYIIGPEGGFTENEVQKAIKHHFIPISLGYSILRAETASITMASILQYEADALSSNLSS